MSDIWVIKDTQTNKWLILPDSADPDASQWSDTYAEHYVSEAACNTIISGWGYPPGARFIGSNPPTPPPKPPGL
jgi:hypothetical protein